MEDVLKDLLAKYEKQWDGRGEEKRLGKMPLEAAEIIVEDYQLPCTAKEFLAEILPWFEDRWSQARALPGANRIIKHLHKHGVPIALASNSPKKIIIAKISSHSGWSESFSIIIGGDEVPTGKPSPEIFLEAAKKLNAEPIKCLVIEDSFSHFLQAWCCGWKSSWDGGGCCAICSNPRIANALPIEPWYIGGPVIKGFGRGSKVLGIPTANLSPDNFSTILTEQACGVHLGWAGLSTRGVFKMVMSVGWNPYFSNAKKTIEPWLLHEFSEDFYGEELRLIVVGYIRPEANFPALEALIQRIHEDGRIAEEALDLPPFSQYRHDPFLKTSLPSANKD